MDCPDWLFVDQNVNIKLLVLDFTRNAGDACMGFGISLSHLIFQLNSNCVLAAYSGKFTTDQIVRLSRKVKYNITSLPAE